jgi:hypothetical protein
MNCGLQVEALESRQVLSHAPSAAGLLASHLRLAGMAALQTNTADGSGASAILNALRGGAGSEFTTLIRRGVPNLNSVIRQFALGRRSEISVKGFAVKLPHFQPAYNGPQLDQFNPTAAGAVILKDGRLELGAIMRGPIDLPIATTYSWGIDRGGAPADPQGYGMPGLRYNSTVSITRDGSTLMASIKDLNTGAVTALDPSSVKIQGPTIRVYLNNPSSLLPSTGAPITKYNFAFWTSSGDHGISSIGGFVPGTQSIQVGNLGPVRPRLRHR